MSFGDQYLEYRRHYTDISGELALAAADDDQTLYTNPASNDTVYIQTLRAYVLTSAAQSASFEDSNGSAKVIARIQSSPAVDSPYVWDFGPKGVPLTVGKNFVINVSAAGLALHIEWTGYRRRTVVASA
jgi:hypothetical protein